MVSLEILIDNTVDSFGEESEAIWHAERENSTPSCPAEQMILQVSYCGSTSSFVEGWLTSMIEFLSVSAVVSCQEAISICMVKSHECTE
jgi:hypothetical protein